VEIYGRHGEKNGTMLKILKEYYTDNIAYVKISNKLSDSTEVTKGHRQGCSLQFYLILSGKNSGPLEEELVPWDRFWSF
jgi:hypothetical protein